MKNKGNSKSAFAMGVVIAVAGTAIAANFVLPEQQKLAIKNQAITLKNGDLAVSAGFQCAKSRAMSATILVNLFTICTDRKIIPEPGSIGLTVRGGSAQKRKRERRDGEGHEIRYSVAPFSKTAAVSTNSSFRGVGRQTLENSEWQVWAGHVMKGD